MRMINTLAVQIRETGLANGWDIVYRPDWGSSDDMIPCRLALIHSEIVEAYDVVNCGSLSYDRDELAAEFADIIIRILDLAGGLTDDFAANVARIEGTLICTGNQRTFNSLHAMVTYALEAFRADNLLKFLGVLALLLVSVEVWATDRFNIDINGAVIGKMDVNRHRAHRHGGKRV